MSFWHVLWIWGPGVGSIGRTEPVSLHVTDEQMKVRRNKNTANTPRRCTTTSWRSLFWHPPTSYKTYVYGCQRQVASFKGNNCLPSKWSRYYSSMLSHKPGFESDRACLGNASPLYTGGWTSTIEYVFFCTCEKNVRLYIQLYILAWVN